MGVLVNKDFEENDELSRRISADLREKAMATSELAEGQDVDLAEDAEYLKDLKKTGRFGWIWIVLVVLAIVSLVIVFGSF